MKNLTDKISVTFFLLLSGYVCVKSLQWGLGTWHKPGSGFLPFFSGLSLGILTLLLLIQNIWLNKADAAGEGKEKTHLRPIIIILVSLFGYLLCLEHLGFIITTILFVGILLKIIEKKGWLLTTWVSLVITLGSYVVFKVWLQAELPKGFFGF